MNNRQKAGISMLVSGLASVFVGVFVSIVPDTPVWIKTAMDIMSFAFPAFGLVVNFPSNTNPK